MVPQRSLIPEEHHGSTWVAKRSVYHLKENGGKRPFFLWSSFIAPHPPFDVPEKWADLYKGKELPPLKESKTPVSYTHLILGTGHGNCPARMGKRVLHTVAGKFALNGGIGTAQSCS